MADEIPLENRVLTDSETVGGTADRTLEDWQKEDPMCLTPPEERGTVVVHDPAIQQRENRIEALRAASQVMQDKANPHLDDVASNTLDLAEQFAPWLETGKR